MLKSFTRTRAARARMPTSTARAAIAVLDKTQHYWGYFRPVIAGLEAAATPASFPTVGGSLGVVWWWWWWAGGVGGGGGEAGRWSTRPLW